MSRKDRGYCLTFDQDSLNMTISNICSKATGPGTEFHIERPRPRERKYVQTVKVK